ncbi:universal stress protein [Streptomyces sp. T028]|uniref:universal stress protein n=1 Tax=Streptomyces sp. T028 TaxID=3394379 RepID=UPI003A87593C
MTSCHIVVGVDGSLVSVRALDRAAAEAVRHGGALRVLYAVSDRDEAAPILDSAVSRTRARCPGLLVETVAVEGGAVRALARESADAVLTVVGTRGLGVLTGSAFGSVSTRLAALAQGPLLVVRGDHRRDDGREVLLGPVDDTDARAALYAFQEAERRGAKLRVLHSWRHCYVLSRLRDLHPDVAVETDTVRAAPADELLAATREAAVVVVGAHRRTGALGPRPGPLTHTLLHHAHCPVAVVPQA